MQTYFHSKGPSILSLSSIRIVTVHTYIERFIIVEVAQRSYNLFFGSTNEIHGEIIEINLLCMFVKQVFSIYMLVDIDNYVELLEWR